jgi:hypothetical protein
MKTLATVISLALLLIWSLPVYARYGPDIRISPTNDCVEGLSFAVTAEEAGQNQMRVSVAVTNVTSGSFSTNIYAAVDLLNKDGFLGDIPVAAKVEGNHMTISVFLDRRVLDQSEIIIYNHFVIHGVDPITNKPTGSAIAMGNAYRIRPMDFLKR